MQQSWVLDANEQQHKSQTANGNSYTHFIALKVLEVISVILLNNRSIKSHIFNYMISILKPDISKPKCL